MQIDIIQGVINGFSSGVGVGLANWILIKRLERIEERIAKKKVKA